MKNCRLSGLYIMFAGMSAICMTLCSGCSFKGKSGQSKPDVTTVSFNADNVWSDSDTGTGNSGNEEPISGNTVILTAGDCTVSLDEMKLYMLSAKDEARALFGDDVFSLKIGEGSDLESYSTKLKEEILKQVEYMQIVCAHADDQGISLNSDDQVEIDTKTADYLGRFKGGEMAEYGITKDAVEKIYSDSMLATKVYESIVFNVNTDVTDEEARVGIFDYIFLSKDNIDEYGNITGMDKDELKTLKKEAENIYNEAKGTDDFYSYAKTVSDDTDEIEITCSKDEMDEKLSDAVFSLKEGEISKLLETDSGYFVFYVKEYENENLTEQKKTEIVSKRQEDAFKEKYSIWENDTAVTVNDKALKMY